MFDNGHRRCINGHLLSLPDVSVMVGTTKLDQLFTPKSCGCWITLDEREVTRLATTGGEEVNIRSLGQRNVPSKASQLLRNMIAAARSELCEPDLALPSMRAAYAFERSLLSVGAWVLAAALEFNTPLTRMSAVQRARLLRRACEVIDARVSIPRQSRGL
jgi:hypothetical protein